MPYLDPLLTTFLCILLPLLALIGLYGMARAARPAQAARPGYISASSDGGDIDPVYEGPRVRRVQTASACSGPACPTMRTTDPEYQRLLDAEIRAHARELSAGARAWQPQPAAPARRELPPNAGDGDVIDAEWRELPDRPGLPAPRRELPDGRFASVRWSGGLPQQHPDRVGEGERRHR
jgi:hypothetical protein